MGGYGAMNVALGNPRRFSIVESWLGFFNGLEDELQAARPVIAREGLHAAGRTSGGSFAPPSWPSHLYLGGFFLSISYAAGQPIKHAIYHCLCRQW
jgi:S-formylglutathione hydrolase FrmB